MLDNNTAQEDPDFYPQHLAEVNKTNSVISTEDIYNVRGILVLRKDRNLNHSAAQNMLKHRLEKPLDHQIALKNQIANEQLLTEYERLKELYPDITQINKALDFEDEYKRIIRGLDLLPLVCQKLTVLQHQMRDNWFIKGVFTAWLSTLIAKEMGMDHSSLCTLVIAGLTHDLGFLHIDPNILYKTDDLNAAEWRAIQAHVIIGQLFLDGIKDIDSRIPRIVLEHHERGDGTGYPAGQNEKNILLHSKVLGMADAIQAIRIHQFETHKKNLKDILPYLQMNDSTFSRDVYSSMINILKKSNLPSTAHLPFSEMRLLSKRLQERALIIYYVNNHLAEFQTNLIADDVGKIGPYGNSLLTTVSQTIFRIASAGLGTDDTIQQLETCENNESLDSLSELNEIELMQNELFWQIKQIIKTSENFNDKECSTNLNQKLSLDRAIILLKHVLVDEKASIFKH